MADSLPELGRGTPLTDEERQGLRLPALTRDELNHAEAENISRAMSWLFFSRRRLQPELVTREAWLKRLHQRMYEQVWAWAGHYRTSDRNLGVPYWQVRMDMRNLEADASAWLTDTSAARYSNDECAIRFGYKLVVIHPFPNGNGRWSRLASDALIVALGGSRFSWGGTSLAEPGVVRRDYIAALQAADNAGDFQPLLAFSRR
ncbi:MAG: mobile mystery protein B [Streptosporangiaceae bacterium]|jgi:Fic-DOC domain mobile mystery protein B